MSCSLFDTGRVDGALEAKLVVQALRINTLSKLTFTDGARFDALVSDVFPGIDFKDIEYEHLAAAYREVCKEKHLLINENQVRPSPLVYGGRDCDCDL